MSDSLAVQTRMAQAFLVYETASYWASVRRNEPIHLMQDLEAAERDYDAALARELQAARARHPDLHPKPVARAVLSRLGLATRGTARLGAGVVLGILWGATGGCVMTKHAHEKFGHFALGVCCEGGLSDLKRANVPGSKALAAKRSYQLHMDMSQARLRGFYDTPVTPGPSPVLSGLDTEAADTRP